ncbi:MAG TPA: WXG100 family type VII secretion target [Anaerolineales bacterium]|nr:WXG100 family type VII secretion target [Anaerolineales bacterium]
MGAPCVRSDHDQLKQIQSTFSKKADDINQMNQNIKSCLQTLEGGDWIGKGATAFFQEMNSSIMPALQKLQRALGEASRVTQQISQVMQDAENETSNVFIIVIV